ncbi:MAG: hypothetical protein ACLP9L_37205 [Thermoguttaceae bacterium]
MAGDNLLELSGSVSYQRLLGEANWPKVQLTGATADRAQPAIDGLHVLWFYHALLRDTIGRAKKLRESVSALLPSRSLVGEIERLLHGPSIELPAAATPLQQRGLVAAAEVARSVEPERMLARMNQLFQEARDVVLAIGAAWDDLPQQFIRFEAELSRLAATDGSVPDEIAAARERLAALSREFDTDPLTAVNGSRALAAEIEAVRTRVEQLAIERRRVSDDLLAARRLLAEVGQSHRRAVETVAQSKLKVRSQRAPTPPCPADDALVGALETWLARLDAEVAAKRWQPVRVGIERWNAAARQYLDADREAQVAGELLLNQRRDLRGLFGALKAKALANGRAEDPALAAIEQQANELLATRPTPLEALQRVVADYQQRLL